MSLRRRVAPGRPAWACALAWLLAALVGAVSLAVRPAAAQAAEAERVALDLAEQVIPLTVKARNRFGREVEGTIPVTSFRPAGDGPFPLVIVNHGRGPLAQRVAQGRSRFEVLARYFVSKGFAVLVPTRLGYSATAANGDPEDSGTCNAPRRDVTADAAADQVLATLDLARTLPWIDASRWVVLGQSVGGLTAVAVAARQPAGLIAAINFAGGSGGRPDSNPGDPCAPQMLEKLWAEQGANTLVPMLWIYWRNDRYWGEDHPRRWAEAWRRGGGSLEFHQLEPVGNDGHGGLNADMDRWVPLVEAYLARAGFTRGGVIARPAPSGHAALDDLGRLPLGDNGRAAYRTRYLGGPGPRAFAIGTDGSFGWARGDWAMGRALGFCQARRGVTCKLYAVDDDVVWAP